MTSQLSHGLYSSMTGSKKKVWSIPKLGVESDDFQGQSNPGGLTLNYAGVTP